MIDAIDLSQVTILNSPDVRSWPATAQITALDFDNTGIRVDFTKRDGAGSWPDIVPPGWDGPLQYTLWLFEKLNGGWFASGIIQYWRGLERAGGNVAKERQIARNWCYDQRWGPMNGYQPATSEEVGFMVTSGNERGTDGHAVAERSNIVTVGFPTELGGRFTFSSTTTVPADPPTPPVDPLNVPGLLELVAKLLEEIHESTKAVLALGAKVDDVVAHGVKVRL